MRARTWALAGRTLVLSLSLLLAPALRALDPEVLRHWSDGRAELDGYALTQPRYGQLRRGTVVLIYVKEDFSESARVKADPGKHPPEDVFPVLKLNVAKDFQTGIYDYNLMTSAFLGLTPVAGRREGDLAKVVFSSQEWCGALFDELLFDPQKVRERRFSYFDGEADATRTFERPEGGLAVDQLPIVVRQIPARLLEPGEKKSLPLLHALERARLTHGPLGWQKGTLERGKAHRIVSVLGPIDVETWTAEIEGGDRYEYDVEVAFPHRLIEWRGPEGERGVLTGSERLKYWEMNREGDERSLARLGLAPLPAAGK